jgi:nucleoside-diphosphate-sugar epimerase
LTEPGGERVLVTGATGFIGGHLVRRLAGAGSSVHATSRNPPGDAGDGVVWHALDLGDGEAAAHLVREVEPRRIYHLASHVAGARDRALVLPTFHANLASTVYLLEAAAEVGCERFVQVGSLEEPDGEGPPEPPSSPYAAAKAAASSYGRMFHQLYGTPVVLARLFMVYGPAQPDVRKLIPYLVLCLLRGEEPKLSSGLRPVDWIYVDDVVEGLVRCGTAEGLAGRRVDLGSGELVTIRRVVETLYRQLAPSVVPPWGTLPDRPHEQVRKARIEETAALLGWRPRIDLEEGLAATADWYRRELAAGRLG